jgi:hypothetical protein
MGSATKPLLILLVVLGALGLAGAGFWVLKSLYDQPIDSFVVSYSVEGLQGTEKITYLSATNGLPTDVKMRPAQASGSAWSQKDAVVGAKDEARVVISGSTSDEIVCTIIRDEGIEFEKALTVTKTHEGGDTICVAQPR